MQLINHCLICGMDRGVNHNSWSCARGDGGADLRVCCFAGFQTCRARASFAAQVPSKALPTWKSATQQTRRSAPRRLTARCPQRAAHAFDHRERPAGTAGPDRAGVSSIRTARPYVPHPAQSILVQGVLCLFLIFSTAGKAAQSGGFAYEVTQSTITITGYTEGGGSVAVPGTIDGKPVTSIGDWAFYGRIGLTSIALPNGVGRIGEYAFSGCIGLTNLILPNYVTNSKLRSY